MVKRIQLIVLTVSFLICLFSMTACESARSIKDTAMEKISEFQEKAETSKNAGMDIQSGCFGNNGQNYAVVIRNTSDKTLSRVIIQYAAYDAEGNEIDSVNAFVWTDRLGPVYAGETAARIFYSENEMWKKEPAEIRHTISEVLWGREVRHVTITDTTENYKGNYNITIKNEGPEDVDLQEIIDNAQSPVSFEFYAVFRDKGGNVTGVSEAYLDDYDMYSGGGGLPTITAGGEFTTTASVYELSSGTPEIVMTWQR